MTIELSAAQQAVVDSRGEHLQVIACAGSGKTEAVSRRVAGLVLSHLGDHLRETARALFEQFMGRSSRPPMPS